MEPRDYVVAICRRWLWVAVAAVAAACCGAVVAMSAAPGYTSTSTVYVSVTRVQTAEALASSSRVQAEVLPSLVLLARSPAVLQPVIDDLGLAVDPGTLADRVAVTVNEGTALLSVSASAADGATARSIVEAVEEQLQEQADELYVDGAGEPLLGLVVTTPPRTPQFASAPHTHRWVTVGLLGGAGAAILLSGLWELLRPRVRSVRDVAALTSVPVLASLPVRGREESLRWLQWTLGAATTSGRSGSVPWLVGRSAAALAQELSEAALPPAAPGAAAPPAFRAAADPRTLRGEAAAGDDVVLVVDSRTATVTDLREQLADAEDADLRLAGIVVEGIAPARAGLLGHVVDAVRGDARLAEWARRRFSLDPRATPPSSRWVVLAALFLIGFDPALPAGLQVAFVLSLVLLPVWIGSLRRYRGATVLAWGFAAVVLTGGLLAAGSAADHGWSMHQTQNTLSHLLGALGAVGLVLWARRHVSLVTVGVTYGLGLLVNGVLDASSTVNAYKFAYSWPITVIVLALAARSRRPVVTIAALLVLGLLDIVNDARSGFGFCVVAAGLIAWQARPRWSGRRMRPLLTLGLLALIAVGGYTAMTEALVSGALGAEVQARSVAQIDQSGSLLLGGRPEWTATWALMHEDPWGHGLGVVPTNRDVVVAKDGMAVAHIPTAEGYIEHYMLSTGYELHSVVADLWSIAGPVGIGLGLLIAGLLVRALLELMSGREQIGLQLLTVLLGLWMLAFGPLPANLDDVAFALGIVLTLRAPVGPHATSTPRSAVPAGA